MILTEAPKDLGGRLFLNCARTIPELPALINILGMLVESGQHTVWPSDFAPDDSDL